MLNVIRKKNMFSAAHKTKRLVQRVKLQWLTLINISLLLIKRKYIEKKTLASYFQLIQQCTLLVTIIDKCVNKQPKKIKIFLYELFLQCRDFFKSDFSCFLLFLFKAFRCDDL